MLWSRNLQLHYPFQNTAKDYSGNARNGTVNGSGVYATKPNGGRCLYFDGTGDYVATPSFGLSGTVVVFAADVRCKSNANIYQSFLGDGAQSNTIGYFSSYRTPPGNTLAWQYTDGNQPQAANAAGYFNSPFDDTWFHMIICCDYTGKKTYFYRNGTLFTTVTMSGTPAFPSTNRVKYIGSYSILWDRLTDGYLANVQLWTLATMPAAAQMLANAKRLMLGFNPIW
jgi:hypothetical protein